MGRTQPIVGPWQTDYSHPAANTLFLPCTLYGTVHNTSFVFHKTTPPAEAGGDEYREIVEILKILPEEVLADLLVQLQGLRDKYTKNQP